MSNIPAAVLPGQVADEQTSSIQRVALASAIGCIIEWYDFFLYGVVAGLVFNKLFFPNVDPLVGTLLAYATFAVGFVARPLGGVIFGHFGDKLGRKSILVLTLIIMGLATFAIGLVPTYASIGIAAPIALVLLRVFQGIGIGGEWGGAVLMAVEYAPDKQRGFYGSWPQVGVPAGLALSTGVVALLSLLPDKQFLDWGWRLAFLFSAVLVLVGIYIRSRLFETPAFRRVQAARSHVAVPFVELFRSSSKEVFQGMGARYIEGVGFNLYGVFSISFLTSAAIGLPRTKALLIVTAAAFIMIFMIPFFGRLSDRVGRRKVFMWGSLASGLLCFPAFWLILTTKDPIWIFVAILIPFGLVYPAVYGPEAALFSELFTTRVRYTGVSFVYQFSGIFASGLTPLIATSLLQRADGKPWLVCGYVLVVSLVSLVSAYSMTERSGQPMLE
jgi:MFS transporter, MHS family, shikimate and dehydroshikimate transport protein